MIVSLYITGHNMPLRTAKRARSNAAAALNKRQKLSPLPINSQPVVVNDSQLSQRPSPRKALIDASQSTDFESRLRDSQPEDAIVAPPKSSSVALTVASDILEERFDAQLEDEFDSLDWPRLPQFIKPPLSQRSKKSWVYRYSYRVALKANPRRLFFVCHYCHQRKIIDAGSYSIYETTLSTSTSARHLESNKRSHGYRPPSKPAATTIDNALLRAIADDAISQSTANELSGFNIQHFRLATVS